MIRAVRIGSLVAAGALLAETVGNGVPAARADTPPELLDLWGWGRTLSGETAGVPPNATIPWPANVVKDWVTLDAGRGFTLGLTATGEVWAWGTNPEGQLGNGTTTGSALPVQVAGLTGITQIAAGGAHALAYRGLDGALFAWGSNTLGQLARPAGVSRSAVPVPVEGLGGLRAIAAGGNHSVVLTGDGRVLAWGANYYGQLGTGDFDARDVPTPVRLTPLATAIGAGESHSVASVLPDHEVWSWGLNNFGQLGRGYQGDPALGEPSPALVVGPRDVVELACGDIHVLARTGDGHLWAWGYNTEGQVGTGDVTAPWTGVLSAVLLTTIDSVADVDAGGVQSIALRTSGEVLTWGNNRFGACGDNGRRDRLSPVHPVGLGNAVAVTTGHLHAMALAKPRAPAGTRVLGLVGNAPPPSARPAFREVAGSGSGFVQVSSGFRHTLALDAERRLWAWGANDTGQLGSAGAGSDDPVRVDLPLDGAVGIVQVSARGNHSLALRSDGAVLVWGDNAHGQLALGTATTKELPQKAPLLSAIAAVAAGERHGLALDRFGRVLSWGENGHGQRAERPSGATDLAPRVIAPLYGALSVAAGGDHSLALMPSGELYAWGSNARGQLGSFSAGPRHVPALVDVPRVTHVSAGRFHTLVVSEGGTLYSFGAGDDCQHGAFVRREQPEPGLVGGLGPTLLVQAGDYHGIAWTYAGELWAWGDDSSGQLGRNDWLQVHSDCDPQKIESPPPAAVGAGLTSTTITLAGE